MPERMCLGCRTRREKEDFIRIVKLKKENSVLIDRSKKAQGRGYYICKSNDCFKKIKKSKRFEKLFNFKISERIYAEVEQEINNE